jgi:hypothetical protein
VVARLPFTTEGAGDQAVVIARWTRDLSEDEVSLIAILLSESTSRGRVAQAAVDCGLTAAASLVSAESEPGRCFHLIEVAGDIAPGDAKLSALGAALAPAFVEANVIGGYARPLTLTRK